VFCNQLNNAAKYSESRGRIAVDAVRADREVVVTVRDTGFGIPDDVLPRVFDMFTQADPAMERSKSGLGVGLTLVKRLIELHGGTVEARSEGLGRGSEFTVRLPLVPDASAATKVSDASVEHALPSMSHRILIVDDNRDAADTMALMLRIKGNIVETAYDGLEAVRVAGEFHPGVALLDIGLPKLDGYETARTIRREKWGTGMVLIAVTGWGQKEDRRRSSEAGFDYHIVKPVDPADLLQLLATLRPKSHHERSDTDERQQVRSPDMSPTQVADPPSAAL
jgi:CheY-like chemotaxis protein